METLRNLEAEKIFFYNEDISEETALFLYKILTKKCPTYKVIGEPIKIEPRFYSLTNLDDVSINERIFEVAEKALKTKNSEEVNLCAV